MKLAKMFTAILCSVIMVSGARMLLADDNGVRSERLLHRQMRAKARQQADCEDCEDCDGAIRLERKGHRREREEIRSRRQNTRGGDRRGEGEKLRTKRRANEN